MKISEAIKKCIGNPHGRHQPPSEPFKNNKYAVTIKEDAQLRRIYGSKEM